nr:DNRLRE domain-containing protein [Verrucomicrobiales bacterium]
FTINTAKMEVIDLGTRFGVTSTALGDSNVFVFEGEVKVNKESTTEAKHLFAGSSLHLGENPTLPDQEVGHPVLPPAPDGDWTPVSTATGQGKDTYIRQWDKEEPTGSDPLLMVKDTDLAPGNVRRALLTFDLSAIDKSRLAGARLALKIESSGLGFSSLVPDSKFAVYGVTDTNAANWSEKSILWKGAGAFSADVIDPSFAKALTTFEIRKGSPNGLVETTSDQLVRFLQSQPGDLVTLMIIRETGESDKQGLVHAFASKEHPTSPAPTLWIQNAPAE